MQEGGEAIVFRLTRVESAWKDGEMAKVEYPYWKTVAKAMLTVIMVAMKLFILAVFEQYDALIMSDKAFLTSREIYH